MTKYYCGKYQYHVVFDTVREALESYNASNRSGDSPLKNFDDLRNKTDRQTFLWEKINIK